MAAPSRPSIDAATQRALALSAQGLCEDPGRRATAPAVQRAIERLGYIQVDAIHVVERAHHHILFSRFDGYRPPVLTRLLEQDRGLFEHWTHDAALLPVREFPQWRHRFTALRKHLDRRRFFERKKIDKPRAVMRQVLKRLEQEGPLGSADFEGDGRARGGWWDWKPAKAALHYLWWSGEITVSRRERFHKIYDLTERVIPPEHFAAKAPPHGQHLEHCVDSALDRLVVATPGEVMDFYRAVDAPEVKRRLDAAVKRGEAVAVDLERADGGKPVRGYARADWETRARKAKAAPERIRLLSPFDPLVRDRKRVQRLFDFDYTFEAFTPAARRKYGYFVLPLLEGDRLVGRVDPKLHRDRGELVVRGPFWEPGVKATRSRRRALEEALELYAKQNGASRWVLQNARTR